MANQYVKESHLLVETQLKNNKTVIKDSSFSAPFKITSPFYEEENNMMKLCVMNISPGMLEGDVYNCDFFLGEGSRLHLFSQSYNKVFTMKDGLAEQRLKVEMKEKSYLEYYMHPTIPYRNSSYKGYSEFHLESGSNLLYREILSCGRYKMGEKFEYNKYSSLVKIYYDSKLVLLDNTVLKPSAQPIEDIGFYEGFTHAANVFIIGSDVSTASRSKLNRRLSQYENISFGISLASSNCLVMRILGNSSEYLSRITEDIRLSSPVFVTEK